MKDKIENYFKIMLSNIKKYCLNNSLFLLYTIILLFNGIIVRYFTVGDSFKLTPLCSDFIIILFVGSFVYLLNKKNQFKYLFTWMLIFSLLGTINLLYYSFYNSFVSVNMLSTLSMAGEVADSIFTKLSFYHFLPFIMPILFYILFKSSRGKLKAKNFILFKRTLIVNVVVLISVLITLDGVDYSRFVRQWNREYIVQKFGIYIYTFNDLIQSLEPKINTMFGYDEAVASYKSFYENRIYDENDNSYTNIFEGKNVIFIHAESIQNFLIDLEVNDIEITPNLNKFASEGLYFSNFYPQISVGTSSDSEFTLTTGLLPSSSGTTFLNYYNRTYKAVPNYFSDMGYYTFSMHGNKASYWNRNVMYQSLGYDYYYAQDFYNIPPTNSEDYIGLGISDKEFFSQSIDQLEVINENYDKFMGTVITLSNHSPFSEIDKYLPLDFSITFDKFDGKYDEKGNEIIEESTVPYLEGSYMGNYLKSAHYADYAFGEFLENFQNSELNEDTVIILYGDHEAKLGKSEFDLLYNYDPTIDGIKDKDDLTYVNIDSYAYDLLKNTPFIIWSSDSQFNEEITDVMGMYDVLPTVANMFGFEAKYALGNDIFSNSEKIVVFPNGNFITNDVYYNCLNDEYLSLSSNPIESDYIKTYKDYADEILGVSKSIIVHDLIEKVGDIFEVSGE